MKGCALEAVSALSHKKNKGGFERMKKNLKKVISAVLALTLAMSSFVVMTTSAASFADVADTASYAEAVNALAALGAISGTGDGTFKPDDNITRAEAATMVVAAQNLSADAQNAGSTSQFADVNESAKWAAGYVNVGVAQGYISGTSATTFNPLDNVTYAQLLTMLTRILGYGDFAASRGGYPNGYLTAASTAGILSGVSAAAEEPITRAQAAQLIWNAVQAPMLDITTFTGSVTDTELKKMDGSDAAGNKFKTVLSDKFDAYVLDVIVTETSKQGSLEVGTISMQLTSSTQWDPEKEKKGSKDTKQEVAVGNTDAEEYVFSSAKVVAEFNDDDEWTLIYFAPTGKVTTKTIDGSLINDNTYSSSTPGQYNGVEVTSVPVGTSSANKGVIRIKKSATSSQSSATEYNIQDAELYVNGIKFCDITSSTADDVQKLLKDATGDVTLVQDDNLSGRVYNKVMIDYYVIASVNQVKADSKSTEIRLTGAVYPNSVSGVANPGSSLKIDADDLAEGDVVVNVVKAGEAADISSIAKNDVVALKYNIKDTLSAFGSGFKTIDIIATTDTASGKYSSYDSDTELYNIGGVEYEAVKLMTGNLTMGSTYTFRLDPFGRLFDSDEEATTVNYAILEKYVDDPSTYGLSAEYGYLDVVTLDGQSKRLYIDSSAKSAVKTNMTNAGYTINTKLGSIKGVEDRIIEYKVKTSTGRVNWADVSSNVDTFTTSKYNSSTNRLSKPLTSAAVVLDATDYDDTDPSSSDYKASSLSALAGSIDYDGVLVHRNNNNQWGYVIITTAGATYSTTSDFVVVAAKASTSNTNFVDDEEVYTITVMQNGDNEATKLNVSMSAKVNCNGSSANYNQGGAAYLKEGAVFFYTTDTYGLVDRIDVVYEGGLDYDAIKVLTQGSYNSSTSSFTAGTMANKVFAPAASEIKANTWFVAVDEKAHTATDEQIQLFIAPVMTAGTSNITFGTMKHDSSNRWYVDTNDDYGFSLADDAKVYEYDLDEIGTGKNAFRGGAFVGFDIGDATSAGEAYLEDVSGQNYTNFNGMVQYALCMAVDGVITNALLFNA